MRHIKPEDVHRTIASHMLADGFDIVLDLRKSRGSTIHDALTGREYLDLFSFFASAPLGMNHPRITEDEFMRHLAEVAANKPSNSDFYTEELAVFVDEFAKTVIPDTHPHLFFVSGGALAVENALKTAFDWKVRKNMAAGRAPKGSKVIHFEAAFHGRTGYTLSLTNTSDPRKHMYFPKFDWPRVSTPDIHFPLEDDLERVKEAEKRSLKQIDVVIEQYGHDIACLIIEPIQGEGGDNHFRPEFLAELRKRADDHEFMLIYDEVQSGLGLTGEWWAWQTLGVAPDIFCFGKKTQTCGIACSRRVEEAENNVFSESSRLNSTWGGNLTDMVRCTRYLEIMREENILENVRARGKQLLEGLHGLAKKYDQVFSVRGRGLMAAFSLPDGETRDAVVSQVMEEGAIVLPCGDQSVRFRPPLNISEQEIDRGLEMLGRAMAKLFD